MNNKTTILAITKIPPHPAGEPMTLSTSIVTLPEPYKAKQHLEALFAAEKALLAQQMNTQPEDIPFFPTENTYRQRIIDQECGEQRFNVLGTRFHVAWKTLPASYSVSDDEFFQCLDAYTNACRGATDFKTMAQRISENMHRYCQNELWKFIKALIRAFAQGRYDDRNKIAHNQAGDILEFMEANDIA